MYFKLHVPLQYLGHDLNTMVKSTPNKIRHISHTYLFASLLSVKSLLLLWSMYNGVPSTGRLLRKRSPQTPDSLRPLWSPNIYVYRNQIVNFLRNGAHTTLAFKSLVFYSRKNSESFLFIIYSVFLLYMLISINQIHWENDLSKYFYTNENKWCNILSFNFFKN